MDILDYLRAILGLAITLGLIGLAAFVLRRYAPQFLERMQTSRGERRLSVVETLVLDPARRLVLVRIDNEERLLLLGEGRELIEPRQRSTTIQPAAPGKAAPRPEPTARAAAHDPDQDIFS